MSQDGERPVAPVISLVGRTKVRPDRVNDRDDVNLHLLCDDMKFGLGKGGIGGRWHLQLLVSQKPGYERVSNEYAPPGEKTKALLEMQGVDGLFHCVVTHRMRVLTIRPAGWLTWLRFRSQAITWLGEEPGKILPVSIKFDGYDQWVHIHYGATR